MKTVQRPACTCNGRSRTATPSANGKAHKPASPEPVPTRLPADAYVCDGVRMKERLKRSRDTNELTRLVKLAYQTEQAAMDFLEDPHAGCSCGFCHYFTLNTTAYSNASLGEMLFRIRVLAHDITKFRTDIYSDTPPEAEAKFEDYAAASDDDTELDI